MPIYEYSCKKCRGVTDFLEGVGAGEEKKVCKHCGSSQLVRIPSVCSISSSDNRAGDLPCCGSAGNCDTLPCSDRGVCEK